MKTKLARMTLSQGNVFTSRPLITRNGENKFNDAPHRNKV